MLLALSLGSALSSVLSWFADKFMAVWNALIEALKWLCVKCFNLILDAFEFMFKALIDGVLFLLDFLPDVDLSGVDEGFATIIEYWIGFDHFVPLTEIMLCGSFLFLYFFHFALIRITIKLIPTIG